MKKFLSFTEFFVIFCCYILNILKMSSSEGSSMGQVLEEANLNSWGVKIELPSPVLFQAKFYLVGEQMIAWGAPPPSCLQRLRPVCDGVWNLFITFDVSFRNLLEICYFFVVLNHWTFKNCGVWKWLFVPSSGCLLLFSMLSIDSYFIPKYTFVMYDME